MRTATKPIRLIPPVTTHPSWRRYNEAVRWALEVITSPDQYVVLDTETTGLRNSDEIIEMAVTDLAGNVLFQHRIDPVKRKIHPEAEAKHHIKLSTLKGEPHFADVLEEFRQAISGKTVVTYNAAFRQKSFEQTCKKQKVPVPLVHWDCAMLKYSTYIGQRYYKRRDSFPYRYQALPLKANEAVTDCKTIVELIHQMSLQPLRKTGFWDWLLDLIR